MKKRLSTALSIERLESVTANIRQEIIEGIVILSNIPFHGEQLAA